LEFSKETSIKKCVNGHVIKKRRVAGSKLWAIFETPPISKSFIIFTFHWLDFFLEASVQSFVANVK